MVKHEFDDVDSVVQPAKSKPKHTEHARHDPDYLEHKQHKQKQTYETLSWILGILCCIFIILFVAAILTHGFSKSGSSGSTISQDEVKTTLSAYINGIVKGQAPVTIESVTDTGDLYLVRVDVGGQKLNSYITKDGKLWFPQGMNLSEPLPTSDSQAQAAPTPQNIPKSDKPKVELFVMSYCPYGTQTEKGILPAARALGDKVDFEVKFVYYAMHGKSEVDENTRQYCIQSEQKDKFIPYLACFLNKTDNSGYCLNAVGVDTEKLNACVIKTDANFNITKSFDDQASWLSGRFPKYNVNLAENVKYSVQGSPTLVINGVEANAGRDSASLLNAICVAYNNAPSECQTQLSSVTPGPGFGYDSTGSAQAAGCGV